MSAPSVQTTLTVTNFTDDKANALVALFKTYIPGLTNVMKFVRPIGDKTLPLDCLMVQPKMADPRMLTTAKYETWYFFDLYYYVGGASIEAVGVKVTAVAETFMKLFSQNALGDGSVKFKQYEPYWTNSEMSRFEFSPAFLLGREGPKYAAVGYCQLKVMTVTLK